MIELLNKILDKSVIISNSTKADVFFDYSGHVNTFELYIYTNGFSAKKDCKPIYISYMEIATEENLKEALEKLDKIEKELK